ncbi:ATP-dependent DNA ligase [Pseudolysinimonas sp.]|jgi:bifunctional non-homologous end joining protein LigD|uniref:ATP-dependent DNA ligase n=1 Tax=Pseudolysinimonas sp. TaxID=2680009 RepID=UPI003782E08C
MAQKTEQIVSVGGHRLKLTNLEKVLYPETGTTKAEVLDYYTRVADVLIPHARNRPVTRKRWVEGVGTDAKPGTVFFEKNLPDSAPTWIPRREIQHSDHVNSYPLVNDLATLAWMAQQASLELHVPQWRFGKGGARQNPDRLVLDLDPGDGAGLPECVEVAKLVRGILTGMGLEAFPVTSGSKGIHLYAPLDGEQTSEEVSAVAHELARLLEADHPDLVVSDMKKTLRAGKVLLDWSQNNGNKTTIVPYSLRGRMRPTVAAPRTWRELLAPGLRQLEMHEVLERVATTGDPAADLEREIWHSTEAAEKLAEYRSMRDGAKTPEPMGGAVSATGNSFVIQEHHATALHYDFRLERDGVLVSWAVPKGVPTEAGKNHLAVHTEDHPLEYGQFEGEIPKGEYGAGTVTIWDRGLYDLEKWRDDEVIVTIHGEKHGSRRLALIQTEKGTDKAPGKNWLLHLMKDQQPVDWDDPDSIAASKARSASGSWKKIGTEPRRGLKRGKSVVGGRINAAGTVHPMLATPSKLDTFPRDDDWVYEMKWDGYRAIATVRAGEVGLRSRNGLDFTATYPELQQLADAAEGDVVLDGEIVALDREGRPSFGLLQTRSGLTAPRDVERARKVQGVEFFVFDILDRDGVSLASRPYRERRALLREAVRDAGVVRVPPDAGTDLDAAVATSRRLGLEGVIAKRTSSPYRLGRRSRDWLKIKHTLTQEVVVAGWRPGNGARADTVGSLLVGIPGADGLEYVGRVGSGFTDDQLGDLRARLDRMARETSPLIGVPPADARDAHWVTPKLVGEVEYAEVTADGKLRAPTWRGWRPDKTPGDVVRET